MKLLLLVGISSCLSGCALTLEMMAISGISYLATGKSLSDNAFSLVSNKDCALHRIIMKEAVCHENEPAVSETNQEFMLANHSPSSTLETEITSTKSMIIPNAEASSDVAVKEASLSMNDFSDVLADIKLPTAEYSSAQTFAVVGSFNNYQYAQRRIQKYLPFNPQIITNQAQSTTKYRVVVGPVIDSDFIAELPIMVGAETQLPWEIDLCSNDMSPPPCTHTYAVNTHTQQNDSRDGTTILSDTQILR